MKKWLHRIVVLCAWALVAGCREKPTGGNPAASASPRGEAGAVVDEKVSVIEVLARPAEFETRVVSVAGYFGAESWLFVSKEHARAGVLEYAVRLHFGSCDGGLGLAPKVRRETTSYLVGGYVRVRGTFVRSGPRGSGMLCEIEEVQEHKSELPP